MNINDPKTLSVAEAVKKVLAPSVKLSEAKMKQLHALYGKGITDPKKLAAELELPNANDEKVIAAVAALVADMEETVASSAKDQSHIDAHDVEKHDDPEQKKQVESTQITEDVTDFRGFKSKDKLVKFTSMAKKLKIKPVGNPTIMKRMGTEYHVQGFSGKVGDIEKSIKVAVEIEKGTIESIDFTKEGNEFTAAAAKAKLAGEDEFEFDGKKYPVEIGQDAAEKILGKKESVELQEAANFGDIEKVMKWAKKNLSGAKLDISKKYGTAFINLTIMNVITLRLGGKKGIVVTHDDRTNGKGKDYEEQFSSASDVIKFVEKKYNEMPKDESANLEEAIKPADFVKGGDAKVTKREVDGMLSKLFIDSKLAKAVESNAAYQDGYKGKVKKNPFKKDTADFHLFELGQQSADAE